MTKITKFEHSTLMIEHRDRKIVIDPGSMTSRNTCQQLLGVEAILVTHRHGDHFDTRIASNIGVPVFGPPEVAKLACKAGLRAQALILGSKILIAGMRVMPAVSNHGPAATQPHENYGYIVEAGTTRIYITSDMAGLQAPPQGPFAAVAVPVEGGGFVFTGREAAEFLRSIHHHGLAIGTHADEVPKMRDEFVQAAGQFCRAMAPAVGESIEL